jgi:peptidyl-prolyl cis-trans isomerase SurA
MKYISICLIGLSVFFIHVVHAQTLIDRVIAVVDKEIITESELNERTTFLALQNRMDPNQPELRQQVLDGLVTEKLVLAQALIDSIEVTDDEVTRALDQQISNFIRQVGSEQRVEQMYGKSLARIKREYRSEIKNQLLVQRIRQQREATISVTRREVEDFFTSFRDSLPQVPEEFVLSHIYIVPKPDPTIEAETRKLMKSIRDSIKAGGDFADFAKRYSTDPGSASSGGDLGWEKRGVFVREFEETVFAMKEGDISDPLKTQFGIHIIQLLGRRGESVHARHILMSINKGSASDSATVDTLRSLRARILKGESFAELAHKYSEDDDTKSIGGDLGTLTIDQIQSDFAFQIKDMKAGEISEPQRTAVGASYGFHIIWMKNRTKPHPISLETDFKRVEQLALYMKRNKLNAEWIDELKKTIYYEIRY